LVAAGASIRLELAQVRFVDAAGRDSLTEMHLDGVGVLATDWQKH
jgi:hypothetical protein